MDLSMELNYLGLVGGGVLNVIGVMYVCGELIWML